MGDPEDVGAEVAAQDVGIGLGGILVFRPEGILPDAVLRAVAAGVGVADDLDETLFRPFRLKELALSLEGAESGPSLLALGVGYPF